MCLWTALASLCVQYPALFGHFPLDILSRVLIMLTGSGSVLMDGLCITLGSTRGLWLVTMSHYWPLIGWWGCSDGLGNIPGPDKCVIPPAYRLFNTSGNYFSSFNNNERAEHQSLSKYAKQERYYLYCSAIRSINGWVTGCWIESRCSLPL